MKRYWKIYDKKERLILTLRGKDIRGEDTWDDFVSFYTKNEGEVFRLIAIIPKSKIDFIDVGIYDE